MMFNSKFFLRVALQLAALVLVVWGGIEMSRPSYVGPTGDKILFCLCRDVGVHIW